VLSLSFTERAPSVGVGNYKRLQEAREQTMMGEGEFGRRGKTNTKMVLGCVGKKCGAARMKGTGGSERSGQKKGGQSGGKPLGGALLKGDVEPPREGDSRWAKSGRDTTNEEVKGDTDKTNQSVLLIFHQIKI